MPNEKFVLTVDDRLTLVGLLHSAHGDYGARQLAQKTAEVLFTAEDAKNYSFKMDRAGNYSYNTFTEDKKPLPITKDFEFGPEILFIIARILRRLNEAEDLDGQTEPLYAMFVLNRAGK